MGSGEDESSFPQFGINYKYDEKNFKVPVIEQVLDASGLGADSRDPFLHGPGDELRSVVGPDVTGNAPQDEEVGQTSISHQSP
jgi:hypothetical protein